MSSELFQIFHQGGLDYYSLRSDVTRYISNFFLKRGVGVRVSIDDPSHIYVKYKPHRDKCYILQKERFYTILDDLCIDLGLKITFKESKCWDTCLEIEQPLHHEEKVVLVGVNYGKVKN